MRIGGYRYRFGTSLTQFRYVYRRDLDERLLAASTDKVDRFGDCFSRCACTAFYAAFTRGKTQASFTSRGIWLLDASRLLGVLRPRSAAQVSQTVVVDALQNLYEQKLRDVRLSMLGADAKMTSCGYLDTSNGLVFTSPQAMKLERKKAEDGASKRAR